MRACTSVYAVALLLGAFSVPRVQGQTTWYVDDDATAGGDGASWSTAYKYLQDALAAAQAGDEIRVAGGTYMPDRDEAGNVTAGDRTATFQLISGVQAAGGYAGSANPGNPDQRDIQLYESILSCDLNGDDATVGGNSENCRHVVTASDVDASAVLDGVTITAGNADGSTADGTGGGMLVTNGGPTLIDCTFSANSAVFGGGMFNSHGTPALSGCTFDGNSASGSGAGMYNFSDPAQQESAMLLDCVFVDNDASGYGGGMRNYDSNPTLDNCTFDGNLAVERGGGMANGGASSPRLDNCRFTGNGVQSFTLESQGGGMSNVDDSDPVLTGCVFEGNSATGLPGLPGLGGALFNSWTAPTLTRCVFAANVAQNGGAIYNDRGRPLLTSCVFRANTAGGAGGAMYTFLSGGPDTPLTLINSAFSGNSAVWDGGALFSDMSALTLTNCTLSRNTAGNHGGGVYNYVACDLAVTNSILWGNSDVNGAGEDSQAHNRPTSSVTPNYTCIQGLTGSLGGVNNIGDDPQFVDAVGPDGNAGTEDDDVRLAPDSPCIEAGDNSVVSEGVDIGGDPRIVDYDGDGTATVDMGAYESQIFSEPIPTASAWGLAVIALAMVAAGSVVIRRSGRLGTC